MRILSPAALRQIWECEHQAEEVLRDLYAKFSRLDAKRTKMVSGPRFCDFLYHDYDSTCRKSRAFPLGEGQKSYALTICARVLSVLCSLSVLSVLCILCRFVHSVSFCAKCASNASASSLLSLASGVADGWYNANCESLRKDN